MDEQARLDGSVAHPPLLRHGNPDDGSVADRPHVTVELLRVQPVVGEVIRRPIFLLFVAFPLQPDPSHQHQFALVPDHRRAVGVEHVIVCRIHETPRRLTFDVRREAVHETTRHVPLNIARLARLVQVIASHRVLVTQALFRFDRLVKRLVVDLRLEDATPVWHLGVVRSAGVCVDGSVRVGCDEVDEENEHADSDEQQQAMPLCSDGGRQS